MTARLLAVCAGAVAPVGQGRRRVHTAIDKRPIDGPVEVDGDGIGSDGTGEPEHHGGVDQALYAYAVEDAAFWADALDREVPPGAFGENLVTSGIDVTGSRVGDRWRIGDDGVEVVVTGPRIPCATFATFWDEPGLVGRFLSARRPGAYLRVATAGTVRAGDPITVVARADHDVTIAEVSRIHTVDRHEAATLLELPDLAHRARDWAAREVAR